MKSEGNRQVTPFDVDKTLITRTPNGEKSITLSNNGTLEIVYPIKKHVEMVKREHNKGNFVIVWSQNGGKWSEVVVKALGLKKYVNLTLTKPHIYVDDLDWDNWSFRIYLEE